MNNCQAYLQQELSKIKCEKAQFIPPVDDYDISDEVRQLVVFTRRSLKLTQNQLSELSGVTQANISKIENGSYIPSLSILQRIATGFGKRLVVCFENLENIN